MNIMNWVDGRELYVTSDLHLSHKNIIRGTSRWSDTTVCRDFNTAEEHDDFIINAINMTVGDNVLLHMGDFALNRNKSPEYFLERLQCKVIFLLGNHDQDLEKYLSKISHKCHFKNGQVLVTCEHKQILGVCDYAEFNVGKNHFVCSHYPMESWHRKERGSIHLHGHCHLRAPLMRNRLDVCVERVYSPLSIPSILGIVEANNQHIANISKISENSRFYD